MRLYSYVVRRDFGFAPNPFHGFCTLATCKPDIRKTANIGDWIIGTGSKSKKRDGHIVYGMRVTETMSFDAYWSDKRFQDKKPNLSGSKKQAFGDNIYFFDAKKKFWHQENSHHAHEDGTPNKNNIATDTKTDRILVSSEYMYWGGDGPKIPSEFRSKLCKQGQGHKNKFSDDFVEKVIAWLKSLELSGYCGTPIDWRLSP